MSAPLSSKSTTCKVHFPIRAGLFPAGPTGGIKAVDGSDLRHPSRRDARLVGESGCGKTTTGRAILQLYRPTSGEMSSSAAVDLCTARIAGELRRARRQMQMIFQDPYASLNPHMQRRRDHRPAPRVHRRGGKQRPREARVTELMAKVGLNPSFREPLSARILRRPAAAHRDRPGARDVSPDFIVCDEPISALDVSIQAQIVNLLEQLRDEFGLTYLFIAHDLSMVRYISTRVAVMYLGKLMELTSSDELYENPLHPYTQGAAVGDPDPRPASGAAAAAHPAGGRPAEPGQPAAGLPLQHALPARHATIAAGSSPNSGRPARATGSPATSSESSSMTAVMRHESLTIDALYRPPPAPVLSSSSSASASSRSA